MSSSSVIRALGGPRFRSRISAAFLASHVAFLIPWTLVGDWAWLAHLLANEEGSAANFYSVILWASVGVLGAAQLLRPRLPKQSPKWLWVLGWLSLAALAGFIAFEELAELKISPQALAIYRWLDLGQLSWPVLVLTIALPLALPAAWALYSSLDGRFRLVLLAVLVGAHAVSAVLRDTFELRHSMLDAFLRNSPKPEPLMGYLLEEGAEIMAAATLVVILVELLAARRSSVAGEHAAAARSRSRRWVTIAVGAGLLVAAAFAFQAEYQQEDERWVRGSPDLYAGPVVLVQQRFRVQHDFLTRIEVWAAVEGGAESRSQLYARLTPDEGAVEPVRESRAEVRHEGLSSATVDFSFAPIPDSGGRAYWLDIGVLSGPNPYTFLGIAKSESNPEEPVVINGVPSPYGNGLAMRTYWVGRGNRALAAVFESHPRVLLAIADILVSVALLTLGVVVTWQGLSIRQPGFCRGFVRCTVRTSLLVMASIAAVCLALFPLLAATPRV